MSSAQQKCLTVATLRHVTVGGDGGPEGRGELPAILPALVIKEEAIVPVRHEARPIYLRHQKVT